MKKHGPWKIKSSKVKYKNQWIEVREDQVIRPDGKDGIYGAIKIKNGVSVLALDEKGYVYLTEEFHYGYAGVGIEAVAGAREDNEVPLEAAKRELEEEAGILAEEWIDLGVTFGLTSYTHHEQKLYLCRKLKFVKDRQDGTETIKLKQIRLEEAIQWVMDNKVCDSYSSLLILKAAKFLDRL